MKLSGKESRQIYIERINTVQDYIEKHLDEELSVQQLSKIASFSEYHFQRIFKSSPRKAYIVLLKDFALKRRFFFFEVIES